MPNRAVISPLLAYSGMYQTPRTLLNFAATLIGAATVQNPHTVTGHHTPSGTNEQGQGKPARRFVRPRPRDKPQLSASRGAMMAIKMATASLTPLSPSSFPPSYRARNPARFPSPPKLSLPQLRVNTVDRVAEARAGRPGRSWEGLPTTRRMEGGRSVRLWTYVSLRFYGGRLFGSFQQSENVMDC